MGHHLEDLANMLCALAFRSTPGIIDCAELQFLEGMHLWHWRSQSQKDNPSGIFQWASTFPSR